MAKVDIDPSLKIFLASDEYKQSSFACEMVNNINPIIEKAELNPITRSLYCSLVNPFDPDNKVKGRNRLEAILRDGKWIVARTTLYNARTETLRVFLDAQQGLQIEAIRRKDKSMFPKHELRIRASDSPTLNHTNFRHIPASVAFFDNSNSNDQSDIFYLTNKEARKKAFPTITSPSSVNHRKLVEEMSAEGKTWLSLLLI